MLQYLVVGYVLYDIYRLKQLPDAAAEVSKNALSSSASNEAPQTAVSEPSNVAQPEPSDLNTAKLIE
ncbi:hypothetical protein DdX_15406 [Ditylenchus destructor]|uniref:Uncharacterized protein n=1 Tax=Ditylenchus destructor TaxID=166010 RepID=A0AAD4R0W2_9BILA|nr:hypothetical protein DdX_15406 [Ditylenchus destructor]